jgi:hypothetical protein
VVGGPNVFPGRRHYYPCWRDDRSYRHSSR